MRTENLTRLLSRAASGDPDAERHLWEHVYPDLKRIAHRELRRGRPGETLQTTALVHEAYFRLVGPSQVGWNDRVHFFATAAKIMRRILINHARGRRAQKRGGGTPDIPLNEDEIAADQRADVLIDLDDALSRLSKLNDRMVAVVECRFFGGMSTEETAAALNVTDRTVRRDWRRARAFLSASLNHERGTTNDEPRRPTGDDR